MPRKSLLALPLVGALLLLLSGPALAESPAPPGPGQPTTHTLTIYNGSHVTQTNFVWRDGSWQTFEACGDYDVFVRDCPRSPWQLYGTYCSPRRAEEVACSLKANGNLASIRRHCP
jgi:hypothetical protein